MLRNEFKDIFGKSLQEAGALHETFIFREILVNGQPTVVTRDYRIDRVNVATINGLITEIKGIG